MRKIITKTTLGSVALKIWHYFMINNQKLYFKIFLLKFRSIKMAEKAKWPPNAIIMSKY